MHWAQKKSAIFKVTANCIICIFTVMPMLAVEYMLSAKLAYDN